MPVDLSPAGLPHAYPARMRFWPWAATWLVCNFIGAVVVLLVWPKAEPANGIKFWIWIVAVPNGLYLALLGLRRAIYETLWYRAYWSNHHRDSWLKEAVRLAQRPLKVIGAGYCVPLGGKSLIKLLADNRSILKMQAARHGSGKVLCNRFEDNDPLLAVASGAIEDQDLNNVVILTNKSYAIEMIRLALEPLNDGIQALTQYERAYWPQVRVLAESDGSNLRERQVRDALRLAGLAPLQVQAVPEAHGLLAVDAWLDARESRPLLLVAPSWYDDEIADGLAEGCVAVLLDPGYFRLPPEINHRAVLHRPVEGVAAEPEYGFANAAVWGKTDAATVTKAWITRPVASCDKALVAAGFATAAKGAVQRRLDLIVGDLHAANGLLAIAAAIESCVADGPHLVVDGLQSAILHVIPADRTASTHDNV